MDPVQTLYFLAGAFIGSFLRGLYTKVRRTLKVRRALIQPRHDGST